MPLPEPNISFTLPSIHHHRGTPLDCRIYHPQSLLPSPSSPQWSRHAAIVAHPYGPLGGSYDDPIVDAVASTLLRLGFMVGTFNFRGAGGSAGRTSWTATAERADYMSMVGFMAYYTHFLDPFSRSSFKEPRHQQLTPVATSATETSASVTFLSPPTTPPLPFSPRDAAPPTTTTPILLMGGYSYGSLITVQLPPFDTILAHFHAPEYGSPAAEIRLRAEHLARTQNTILAAARAALVERLAAGAKAARRSLPPIRVGGDEDRRISHDSRRSLTLDFHHHHHQQTEERIRKGVADLIAKARRGGHASSPRALHEAQPDARTAKEKFDRVEGGNEPPSSKPVPGAEKQIERLAPVADRAKHSPVYLLISPLQGVANSLATMSFMSRFSLFLSPSKPASRTNRSSPPSKSGSHKAASQAGPDTSRKPTLKLRQPDISRALASPSASTSSSTLPSSPPPPPPLPENEQKLVDNPTMAIYGDRDVFVTARKLRDWAATLQGAPGSRFRAHEVSSAGHFWTEDRLLDILENSVRTFGESVLRPGEQNVGAVAAGAVVEKVGNADASDIATSPSTALTGSDARQVGGTDSGAPREGVATAVASAG